MLDFFIPAFLVIAWLFIKISFRRNETTDAGAPFVPLEPEVVERVISLAKVKPGDVFYDLGSGDGRVVIAAALKGAKATGIEIDLFRVWYSRICIFMFGLSGKAKIIHKNIFEVNLSDADIVTVYLLQETNNKLFEKFGKELKTGTRVVSSAFKFSKWKLIDRDQRGPIYGPISLYHANVMADKNNSKPKKKKQYLEKRMP